MGCDIHMYTEVKKHAGGTEQWANSDNWRLNDYWTEGGDNDGEQRYTLKALAGDRNYALFTALAGVRDYSEGSPKLGAPKGLPADVCAVIRAEAKRWDGDGHSHSYWTLRELIDFQDKNKSIKHAGLVTATAAQQLDDEGIAPTMWCQGSNDKSMVHREWEEDCEVLAPLIEALNARMKDALHIWDDDKHPDLEAKIRIVFWFDN